MFFEREYLNRALKSDPYNLDANILMGRLNQRQRKYAPAYNCYSIVVAKAKDSKTYDKYLKRMNKMKKKLDKQYGTTTQTTVKPVTKKTTGTTQTKKSFFNKTTATNKPANSKVNYSPKEVK